MIEGMRILSQTRRNKRRLNTLGRVTLTTFVLFMVILIHLSWELISHNRIEAENGKQTTIAIEVEEKDLHSNNKSKQVGKAEKKTEQQLKIVEKRNNHSDEMPNAVHQQQETDENAGNQVALETGKVIYLTFDDGPHPTASKDILQLLDKYNAKATYFMLAPHMKRNPDIVNVIKEKGHTIGAHGVTHDISKIYKSPDNFINEMTQAINFIKETAGIDTRIVRAPYGSKPYITPPFKEASDNNQLILWDWNVDSQDWKLTNGEFVNHAIQQIENLEGKEPLVVLMHEKTTTAAHLETLLQFLQKKDYQMKAINESMIPIQF